MKLETPFIAVILGALFFSGMFSFYLSMTSTYNVPVDMSPFTVEGNTTRMADLLADVNASKTEMDQITQSFSGATLGDSNDVFEFLRLTWVMGKQVFNNMFLMQDILMALTQILGIPADIVMTFITILFIVFVISVLMIIIGRSYE